MSETNQARRSLARGGIAGFVGAAASAVLGFAFTIILSRMLGAQGAGVVTQATGVFAIVMALAKVGLDSTAIYLLPRLSLDAPQEIRATLSFMATMTVAVSTVCVLVLEVAAPFIWDAQVASSTRAVLWFVPIGALTLVASAALRALGNMREYVLVQNLLLPGLRPLLVALAAALTGSLALVSVAWALPFVVVLVAAWWLLLRHMPSAVDSFGRWPSSKRRRQVLSFALPRTLTAGLEQALQWLDVLLVGMLAGNAASGIYGGAIRFIQAGMVVDTALRVVVSPQFSKLLHRRRTGELRDLYGTASIWLVLFAAPIYALMAIFAPALMRILGDGFAPGASVLVVLCIGSIVTFMAGNIHSLLIMSGRSGWAAVNKIVVLALNIVGNIIFIPRGGMVAAAIVWAVCMVLDAAMATVQVSRFVGVTPKLSEVVKPILVVGGSVAIPGGCIAAVLGRDSFVATVTGSLLSILTFACACWIFRERLHLTGLGSLVRARKR